MTGAVSEERREAAEQVLTAPDRRAVQRRANQLCRRAEPHTDEIPCPGHLQEAQRQLFGPAA